jgi:hypothetical protein
VASPADNGGLSADNEGLAPTKMASPLTMRALPQALPPGLAGSQPTPCQVAHTSECVLSEKFGLSLLPIPRASNAPLPLPEPSLQTLQTVPARHILGLIRGESGLSKKWN